MVTKHTESCVRVGRASCQSSQPACLWVRGWVSESSKSRRTKVHRQTACQDKQTNKQDNIWNLKQGCTHKQLLGQQQSANQGPPAAARQPRPPAAASRIAQQSITQLPKGYVFVLPVWEAYHLYRGYNSVQSCVQQHGERAAASWQHQQGGALP